MAEHTPGPWFAAEDGLTVTSGAWPLGLDIVHCANEGDAHLIAAAPALLDHARLFARSLEYGIRKSENSGDDEGARLKAFTLALVQETIAAAEGRS